MYYKKISKVWRHMFVTPLPCHKLSHLLRPLHPLERDVLYGWPLYTYTKGFSQCTPIRGASSARDPRKESSLERMQRDTWLPLNKEHVVGGNWLGLW